MPEVNVLLIFRIEICFRIVLVQNYQPPPAALSPVWSPPEISLISYLTFNIQGGQFNALCGLLKDL